MEIFTQGSLKDAVEIYADVDGTIYWYSDAKCTSGRKGF